MSSKKKAKYQGVANPTAHKADMERRRSSAASPQESRDKRLRTRQAIIAQARREALVR